MKENLHKDLQKAFESLDVANREELLTSVGAVPVVRCKDCKHMTLVRSMHVNGKERKWCKHHGWVTDDWFCADGARMDEVR